MWPALLAGAGLGLTKSILVDQPQADKQRQLAATTASLSPWTGLTPNMPKEANAFGAALEGASAGAMLGQGAEKNAAEVAKLKAETNALGSTPAVAEAATAVPAPVAQAPIKPKPVQAFTQPVGVKPQPVQPQQQMINPWDVQSNYVMMR